MEYRVLGKTGLNISRLGFGGIPIQRIDAEGTKALMHKMKDAGIRAARLNAVYIPLVLFFSTMAVSIVLLRGGHLVMRQVLELATLSTFISYAMGIFEPIQMTAANIAEFISLQASIERVTDLLDKEPHVKDSPEVEAKYGDAFHPKKENWEPLHGEIEFKNVTFRYPDGGFRGWGCVMPVRLASRTRYFWLTFDRHNGSDYRWSYGNIYCFEADEP